MQCFCFSFCNPGLYRDDGLLAVASSISEHSQGAASGRHESWEFDSGACDLVSPEPDTLYKLIEAAGGSLKDNSSKLLDMANKVGLQSSIFCLCVCSLLSYIDVFFNVRRISIVTTYLLQTVL